MDATVRVMEAEDRESEVEALGVIGTDGKYYRMTAVEYFMRCDHPEVFDRPLSDFAEELPHD